MGATWGYAVSKTLTPDRIALGGKKTRGFWKNENTVKVLQQFVDGEISQTRAAEILSVPERDITYYVAKKKLRKSGESEQS